jgi:hypothetical protein
MVLWRARRVAWCSRCILPVVRKWHRAHPRRISPDPPSAHRTWPWVVRTLVVGRGEVVARMLRLVVRLRDLAVVVVVLTVDSLVVRLRDLRAGVRTAVVVARAWRWVRLQDLVAGVRTVAVVDRLRDSVVAGVRMAGVVDRLLELAVVARTAERAAATATDTGDFTPNRTRRPLSGAVGVFAAH